MHTTRTSYLFYDNDNNDDNNSNNDDENDDDDDDDDGYIQYHNFLVIDHHSELLSLTNVIRHSDNILLRLLAWCCDGNKDNKW